MAKPNNILVMVEYLTPREQEVLDEMAKGHSNPDIAISLFLTTATVKTHVSNIIGKLVVENRTEAVLKAQQLGLVDVINKLSPAAQTILALVELDPSALKQLVQLGIIKLES